MGSSAASPLPMPPPPLSTPLPLFAPPGFCPNPAAAAASATATATSATSRKRVYHQTAHSDRPLLKRVSTPLPHWSRPPSPSPSLPLHDRHYHRGYDYDHDYDHNQPRRTTTMKAKKRSRPTSNTGGARGNGGGGSDGNLPAAAAPVRINVENTTLSVRKQLSLVRRFQEQQQLGDTPKRNKPLQRTSFRRQKDDEQQRRRRKRNAEVRDTDIPDGKYETDVEPIMFVDGYNVIGRWPRLRKWRDRDDLEHARRLLLDDVAEFSAVRGWECVVVFDAGGSDLGERQDESDGGVSVVFTGSETADSYIERHVYETCNSGQRPVWASTSDLVQARVTGAAGAHVMSSSLFIQELKRTREETEDALSTQDGAAYRAGMLMSNIDPDTLRQLYRLRDGEN